MSFFSYFLLFLILAASSEVNSSCAPPEKLPFKSDWLGGDVGSSVKLGNGKTLWIFGDTFVGRESTRNHSMFINNSIALSSCKGDSFVIDYFWSEKEKKPFAYFVNRKEGEFYWPLSGTLVKNTLIISLLRLRYDQSSALGFSEEGVDLVRIKNVDAPPNSWVKEFIALSDRRDVFPATEFISEGDYVYIYSYRKGGPLFQENVIARLNRDDLLVKNDLRNDIFYKSFSGLYLPYSRAQAKVVNPLGNTELSIKKIGNEWMMVQMRRNVILGISLPDQVVLSRSSHFEGPWGKEEILLEVPETIRGDHRYEKNNFCYAAKLHENFRISYVCNSYDQSLIFSKMDIYTPVFIPQ